MGATELPHEFDFDPEQAVPCPLFYPGDLVVFYGRQWQSRVIELVTRGPSHIGIILHEHSRPLLFESTSLCDLPCVLLGEKVRGVQAHDPWERAAEYDGPAYRLPIKAKLYPEEAGHLTCMAIGEFLGKPYDLAGALESGPHWLKPAHWLYPDLGTMHCSALAAHLLMRLGRMNWENPKAFNPADVVARVLNNGTHGQPELIPVGA